MAWGEVVEVTNRTSKPLEFKFDGAVHVLKPYPEANHLYESLAGFAKSKFPINGTEDYCNPLDFQCLIGVKAWGDNISPIEQDEEAGERLNRATTPEPVMRDGKPGKIVKGPSFKYRPMPQEPPRNHTEFAGGVGTA